MKLDRHFRSSKNPLVSVHGGGTLTVIALCLGSAFLVILVAFFVCFLYRRRSLRGVKDSPEAGHTPTLLLKRSLPAERPITLKRPTAVKSPGTPHGPGPTLKKSPSPSGNKSPPSIKAPPGGVESGRSSKCDSDLLSESAATTTTIEEPLTLEAEVSGGTGERSELGVLHFKLKYNYSKRALYVTVNKCVGLPSKEGTSSNSPLGSDPYVKLQLMPTEKRHKVKTRVLRKTLNPVYDEEFTFLEVEGSALEETSLLFVVLSFDRYSRDAVIGEVQFPLAQIQFDTLEKQVSLVRDIVPRSLKLRTQGRGEVLLSLCWQPAANRLTVVVLKARNLPKMDLTGLCDPYVKLYLLHKKTRLAKKKTHVKKKTTCPVFNESFVFDVPPAAGGGGEGLDDLSLELLVLDYDRVTRNEVIGKLEIGPRAIGAAGKHWKDVINSPRRQIAEWHKLVY